jgi:hypothetical protein
MKPGLQTVFDEVMQFAQFDDIGFIATNCGETAACLDQAADFVRWTT